MKKYNKFAIKNIKGEYIKYSTAYNYSEQYTDSLYDVHLWNTKECAEKMANYLNYTEGKKLKVVNV